MQASLSPRRSLRHCVHSGSSLPSNRFGPAGDTWYEALQAKVTGRLSHGLSFLSTFTWAKSEDPGTEIGEPNPGTTGNAVVNDRNNRAIKKYLSEYDQPL
jgi:hypothetical protein